MGESQTKMLRYNIEKFLKLLHSERNCRQYMTRLIKSASFLLALCLLATACGGDSDSSDTTVPDSVTEPPAVVPTTTTSLSQSSTTTTTSTVPPTTSTTGPPEPVELYPPEGARRFFLFDCEVPEHFEGKSAVIDVLTDDTQIMQIYTEFEFPDCASLSDKIVVRLEHLPPEEAREKILADLGSDEPTLEVIQADLPLLRQLAEEGKLLSLSSYLEANREDYITRDIIDAYMEMATLDGEIYGIPAAADMPLLYLNTLTFYDRDSSDNRDSPESLENPDNPDSLESLEIPESPGSLAPTTFADLIALCQQWSDSTSFLTPLATPEDRGEFFGNLLRAAGGSWLNEDGTPAFASEEGVQAANVMRQLIESCMDENWASYTAEDILRKFSDGDLPMAVLDASYAASLYRRRSTPLWSSYATAVSELAEEVEKGCQDRYRNDEGYLTDDYTPEVRIDCFHEYAGTYLARSSIDRSAVTFAPVPKLFSPDGTYASSPTATFFAIPASVASDESADPELIVRLLLDSTDYDSQQPVKYFGLPTRNAVTPDTLTLLDLSNYTSVYPLSPPFKFAAGDVLEEGLPAELPNPARDIAVNAVGMALSDLDSGKSAETILREAEQEFTEQARDADLLS